MIVEDALNIYTDGSSLQSPRVGGIGIRYVTIDSSGNEQIQDIHSPGYKNATNNQMELQACILALKEAMQQELTYGVNRIVIYSDSLYIVDYYKKAMIEWPKTKWLRRSGRPVLNADLWKELVKCIKKIGMSVEIRWVKGHSKSIHNKAADRMARESANLALNKPLSAIHVRRKLSPGSVELGSVEMEGQRISIRIIICEYLKVQKIWKYKYEVLSKKSKFYGKIDIIFSDKSLDPGHSYYLRVNSDTSNPRIIRVFREINLKD